MSNFFYLYINAPRVSIYKNIDNLHLIFCALEKQTFKNFEVVVSEDNNATEVVSFLEEMRKIFHFPIKHVSQEDLGFRKTRILNKALLAASGEKLVFLDGDCLPHHCLLDEYNKALTPTSIAIGRRTYLNKKITDELLATKDLSKLSVFNLLVNADRLKHAFYLPFIREKKNTTRRIIGCNWGIYKKNLLDINGYDEDYNRPGRGEDFDVDWRLRKNGLSINNIKHKVITYHLFHPSNHDTSDADTMEKLMQGKIAQGYVFCKNGIVKS